MTSEATEAAPLAFNRQAIIDAYVTFAYVNACARDALTEVAWKARVEHVKDLSNVSPWRSSHDDDAMRQIEAVEELDDDTRPHYFALLVARLPDEKAETIREDYERRNKIDGVTVDVSNTSDDDGPMRIDFVVRDRIAEAWADREGDIAGDTWQSAGDSYVYASTYWYPGLIEELQKDGYDLDLSEFSEPDEADIAADEHRREYGSDFVSGGCCRSHYQALEHVEQLEAEQAAAHWEGFVDALALIAHLPLDTWQPKLFGMHVLYPGVALTVGRRRLAHEGTS